MKGFGLLPFGRSLFIFTSPLHKQNLSSVWLFFTNDLLAKAGPCAIFWQREQVLHERFSIR
jgi:hypothetical protein